MTDPDDRHSRSRAGTPPPPPPLPISIQQPNFLPNLAANIPQVHIPDSIYAPLRHVMPQIPPAPVRRQARGRGRGRGQAAPAVPPVAPGPRYATVAANAALLNVVYLNQPATSNMPSRAPRATDDPFTVDVDNSRQPAAGPSRVHHGPINIDDIIEVQLPAGWDAPLANPMPQVPPPPPPMLAPRARTRRRSSVIGPLHDISGGTADPALNGLHRGHIAYRERQANHLADRQAYLLAQQVQQAQLLREQELFRNAAAAALQEEVQRREPEAREQLELMKRLEAAEEEQRQRTRAAAETAARENELQLRMEAESNEERLRMHTIREAAENQERLRIQAIVEDAARVDREAEELRVRLEVVAGKQRANADNTARERVLANEQALNEMEQIRQRMTAAEQQLIQRDLLRQREQQRQVDELRHIANADAEQQIQRTQELAQMEHQQDMAEQERARVLQIALQQEQ